MFCARSQLFNLVAAVGVVAIILGGCTVKLVSDYDEQIDSGATTILSDTTSFIKKMNNTAGSPAGDYDHNKDFYADEHGKVVALEARANAIKVLGNCPATSVAARVAKEFGARDQVIAYLEQAPADDCLVIELKQLDAAITDLENFHMAQGSRGIPPAAANPILEGGIGSIARTIIFIETKEKADNSGEKVSGS